MILDDWDANSNVCKVRDFGICAQWVDYVIPHWSFNLTASQTCLVVKKILPDTQWMILQLYNVLNTEQLAMCLVLSTCSVGHFNSHFHAYGTIQDENPAEEHSKNTMTRCTPWASQSMMGMWTRCCSVMLILTPLITMLLVLTCMTALEMRDMGQQVPCQQFHSSCFPCQEFLPYRLHTPQYKCLPTGAR